MSSDLTGPAGPVVDDIAHAVLAVPGVEDLHRGVHGEVATYLPGRRVNGIRLRESGCEIHVVLAWDSAVAGSSERIRAAARPWVTGPIDVTVEDFAEPGGVSR